MAKLIIDILQQYTGVVGVSLVVGFVGGVVGSFLMMALVIRCVTYVYGQEKGWHEKVSDRIKKLEKEVFNE